MVVEREFVNPGKGSAFCRVRLKGLTSGKVYQETFKTQDSVEDIQVEEKTCQYLYSDGEAYHFMHNDTFEQFEVHLLYFVLKYLFLILKCHIAYFCCL